MIKVYGHPMSTCTRKVIMTLLETKTPHELYTLDFMAGDHKKPDHLVRQPFGRMPAIDDDGFVLYESRAISRYINDKASGKLAPSDPKARAKMEQWISVETSELTPHAMKFVYHHIFQRPQEAAALEAAGKALDTTLGVMDKALADSPFIAGGEFTLADIAFMPYLEYVAATPAKSQIEKHGRVASWWNKIRERATWKKATGQG